MFSIMEVGTNSSRAECTCKPFHARADDGACYRLYTRGPCEADEMVSRGGRCVKVLNNAISAWKLRPALTY